MLRFVRSRAQRPSCRKEFSTISTHASLTNVHLINQEHLLHKLGGKKDLHVAESLDRVLHHCGHARADIPVPALVICEMKASGVHILNVATRASAGYQSICLRMYVFTDERCAQSRDVLLWASNLVRPLLTVFAHGEAWDPSSEGQTQAGRRSIEKKKTEVTGGSQWISKMCSNFGKFLKSFRQSGPKTSSTADTTADAAFASFVETTKDTILPPTHFNSDISVCV